MWAGNMWAGNMWEGNMWAGNMWAGTRWAGKRREGTVQQGTGKQGAGEQGTGEQGASGQLSNGTDSWFQPTPWGTQYSLTGYTATFWNGMGRDGEELLVKRVLYCQRKLLTSLSCHAFDTFLGRCNTTLTLLFGTLYNALFFFCLGECGFKWILRS